MPRLNADDRVSGVGPLRRRRTTSPSACRPYWVRRIPGRRSSPTVQNSALLPQRARGGAVLGTQDFPVLLSRNTYTAQRPSWAKADYDSFYVAGFDLCCAGEYPLRTWVRSGSPEPTVSCGDPTRLLPPSLAGGSVTRRQRLPTSCLMRSRGVADSASSTGPSSTRTLLRSTRRPRATLQVMQTRSALASARWPEEHHRADTSRDQGRARRAVAPRPEPQGATRGPEDSSGPRRFHVRWRHRAGPSPWGHSRTAPALSPICLVRLGPDLEVGLRVIAGRTLRGASAPRGHSRSSRTSTARARCA